jgi:hypothetical protein
LNNPDADPGYSFVFSFQGVGSPTIEPPDPCVTDAITGQCNASFEFRGTTGEVAHFFLVTLSLSGPVDSASWGAFNPQPDPPGDVLGLQFSFGLGNPPPGDFSGPDPMMTFSITEDGNLLSFAAVPEPTSLALFGSGLIGLALFRRRRVGM